MSKTVPTVRDLLMLTGLLLVVAGVARLSIPAGMIVAGVILVVGGRG